MEKRLRVLLVEDAGAISLRRALAESTHRSFDVERCDQLCDALASLEQRRFDVLLIDSTLPDADSIDTQCRVRKIAPDVATVVLTGRDELELVDALLASGVRDLLTKHPEKERTLAFTLAHAVERQRMLGQLRAERRQLERFVSVASHDLRGPARLVVSSLELTLQEYGGTLDEGARRYLGYALEGGLRLIEMVDALLRYSRADTGPLELRTVDVGRVVDALNRDLAPELERRGATLVRGSLPQLACDAEALRTILEILIANGIQYHGGLAPRIQIDASRAGRFCEIRVQDDGVGIDATFHERVFEPFRRLHTREEHPGTGIGLAIARRLAERLGGGLRLESESGEGTTAIVALPVDQPST